MAHKHNDPHAHDQGHGHDHHDHDDDHDSGEAEQITFSPATVYRLSALSLEAEAKIEAAASAYAPDDDAAESIAEITQAADPRALVRLAMMSTGPALGLWLERFEEMGSAAIPAIVQRLRTMQSIEDAVEQDFTAERLILALHRLGPAGLEGLRACFNNLSDHGQSLACVVFGWRKAADMADAMHAAFERMRKNKVERYFVGPLWGLADLRDARMDEALAALYLSDQGYYESAGFAALCGGARTAQTMFQSLLVQQHNETLTEQGFFDVLMALAGIGHRLGLEPLRAALKDIGDEDGLHRTIDVIVSKFEPVTPADVNTYFEIFFT